MSVGAAKPVVADEDVVMEEPIVEEALHDINIRDFDEHFLDQVTGFTEDDHELLADMLSEQARREATGPTAKAGSSAGPATGADTALQLSVCRGSAEGFSCLM
ncbi:uncharacterized protein LOC109827081 [Asparagus officinalis]|uniref:uncharacterized protein LOC109827081 n=1 Tax=Asparagus officinalis TaxID=4686 RepID=UPI00098DFE94|nr:uncharacterized protein LOC109827081 [Asparagus officinalis]